LAQVPVRSSASAFSLYSLAIEMNILAALAILVAPAAAIMIGNITKCQTGKTDLVGTATNVFTVQVCNLFGATCYVNHPETVSSNCATEALKIDNLQCALFPIMSYQNKIRTDASKLLVGGGASCSVSCTGTDCKFSGECVSVQCSLGGTPVTYAGPAKTGTTSARTVGITDTAAAGTFQVNDFASLAVSGSKTVLLSRTGGYVGTYARGGSASGTVTYDFGKLPTIAGSNYGPKACPGAATLVSAATGTSKEELRVCGNTGKWVYFGAANLVMDKSMYAKYSADSATGLASTQLNIAGVPFLSGSSQYRSGAAMDDSRAVYLHDGAATTSVLLTSGTISPAKSTSTAMGTQEYAGTWRFYTVVFYCDNYARTDLTACPTANQKMFYVADPNPAPAFGITAATLGGGSTGSTSTPVTGDAMRVAAGLAALITFALNQL